MSLRSILTIRPGSPKARFVNNVGFKSTSDFVSRLATFVTTIFLARSIGQEQFGIFSLGLSVALVWGLLMDLGWNNYLIRNAKKGNFKSLVVSVLILKLAVVLVLLLLTLTVPRLIPAEIPKLSFVFLFVYGASLYLQELFGAAVAGLERFDVEWMFRLIARWGPLIVLVFLLRSNPTASWSALVLAVSSFFITIAALMFFLVRLLKGPWEWDPQGLSQAIREGLPYGIAVLIWGSYTKVDVILLGLFDYPMHQVGTYAAAIKLVDFLRGLALMLSVAILPILNDYETDHLRLWNLTRKIGLLIGGICLALTPIVYGSAGIIMRLLYGAEYVSGAGPLFIGLLGGFLFLVCVPFQASLLVMKKSQFVLFGNIILFLTCIVANLILLPGGTISSPAWAILIAEFVGLSLSILFLRNRLKNRPPLAPPA